MSKRDGAGTNEGDGSTDGHQPIRSTIPTGPSTGWDLFERVLRIVAVCTVFGVVIAALFGLAGLTTAANAGSSDSLTVRVEYAEVSRPGIATPLVIEIASQDGATLPAELTVEIPRHYLDMFDENGLDPAPDSVTSDGVTEIWTFEPGDVSVLSIDFDARLQPNSHFGRDGWVIVRGDGDEVRVDFHTRVLP
jgi:hypothetical protein